MSNNERRHESMREDLKAYADGELPLARRMTVRAHLTCCADCRKEIEEMNRIVEDLKASVTGTHTLNAGLRARLLDASKGLPVVADHSDPLWKRQPLWVFGGGGSLVAASLALFAYLNSGPVASPMATSTPSAAGAVAARKSFTEAGANLPRADMRRIASSAPAAEFAQRGAMSRPVIVHHIATAEPASQFYAEPSPNFRPMPQLRASQPTADMGGDMSGSEVAMPAERQVHKEASLGVAVEALEATSDRVEEMVKADGGFVASNNLTTDGGGYKSAELSVRVPTKDFESMMASFAKLGSVVSKNVSGEDITEKVGDGTSAEQVLVNEIEETERKLNNQTMSERRTGQKEAELRSLRFQLAQTRSRLGLLRRMAALSTINISLTEKRKPVAPTAKPAVGGLLGDMGETNRAAMRAFQAAVRVPIVMLIWVLAFTPIWVPLVLFYRYAALKSAATRLEYLNRRVDSDIAG